MMLSSAIIVLFPKKLKRKNNAKNSDANEGSNVETIPKISGN